ncbi:hypothetical protein JCM6882_000482 [Rhodosporidiobolus microsporus]
MLDRLPVELLSHVLRLAAPLEYTPDKYRERRELLRQCCLVCKRVRDIAQPMLPEVYRVRTKEDEERLVGPNGGPGITRSKVKVLAVSDGDPIPGLSSASYSYLSDLRLLRCRDFSLNVLSQVPGLRRLVICDSAFTASQPCALTALVELSLLDGSARGIEHPTLFTSTYLPNLRALALTISSDDWCEGERVLPPLPPTFLNQLEVLGVDVGDITMQDLPSLSPAPVLVDASTTLLFHFDHTAPLPFALRLLFVDNLTLPSTAPQKELDYLTGQLTNVADDVSIFAADLSCRTPGFTSLRLLVLPDEMAPDRPLFHLVEKARTMLLEACKDCQVEVLYDEPVFWPSDSLVSPVFWECARRSKREEAAKGKVDV